MTHNVMKMRLQVNGTWKDEYPIFKQPVPENVAQKTMASLMRSVACRSDVSYIVIKDEK